MTSSSIIITGLAMLNINGRLIPTAEVTSLIEQTTKARITEIYLFKKNENLPDISVCNTNLPWVQPPRKVCIANQNIGQKLNKYISVILAFVVCSIKLATSAVAISLPLIFCI